MTNELVLRLPNGQRLSTIVDDAGLRAVIAAFAEQGGPAVQRAVSSPSDAVGSPIAQWTPAPPSSEQTAPLSRSLAGLELDQGESAEFGGDYAGPPDTTDAQTWIAPEVTGLRVSADAMGNPVIQGNNVRDSRELVGGRNAELEDDGVGSV